MLLVLVLMLASVGSLTAQDRCELEQDRSDAAFRHVIEARDRSEQALTYLAEISQAERLCIGESTERTGLVLSRELWALEQLGRYEEARHLAEMLMPAVLPVATPKDAAYILTRYGATNFRFGRYSEAAGAYREAVRIAPVSSRGVTYLHLATLLRRTHRLDEALAALDSAAAYVAASQDPSFTYPRMRLQELDLLALSVYYGRPLDTLRVRSLIEEREDIFAYSFETFDEVAFVETASEFSTLYLALRDTVKADEMIRRLDRPYRADRYRYTALRARGAYSVRRGDYRMALHYYRLASEGTPYLSPNNAVDVFTSLGDLTARDGDLDSALDAYLRAEDLAFQEAHQGIGSDLTAALYRNVKRAGRRSAGTLLRHGRPEEALSNLDRVSARYLNTLRSTRPSADNVRAREIDNALSSLRAEMRRLSGHALVAARARESALVAELDQLLPPPPPAPELDLDRLQARLHAENQVMLVYRVDDPLRYGISLGRPHLIVVTPDEILPFEIETSPSELADLIAGVSPLFRTGRAGITEQAFELRTLHRLYQLLIEPAAAHILPGARLVIVPDGPLYDIPFSMLVRTFGSRFDYASARYLIHDHAISVELSPSLYLEPGGDRNRNGGLAALARSRFEDPSLTIPLPATGRETRSLQRMFSGVRVYSDRAATPQALYTGLRDASAVHVATHATLDPASHLNHAILLSPDELRTDGSVYAFDLLRRDFGTPFVALTGCATAAGPVLGGEGMAGFQYAFRSANVGSVLSTHWLVDDDVMADMTAAFYRELSAGVKKDEALRRAQLAYLSSAREIHASPFFWAAPVIYGDTEPIVLPPAVPVVRNLAAAVAVFAAFVVLAFARRRFRKKPTPPVATA